MFLKNCILCNILLLALLSCNKTVQRDKFLQGSWNLTKVTIFDYDGLSYSTDTSCSGQVSFNKELDTSFTLDFSYSIYPLFIGVTTAKGRYILKDDAEYLSHEILTVSNLDLIPADHSRILFLTKDYFKWEFISSLGIRYHLTFQKK